jgi:hypothetical protein
MRYILIRAHYNQAASLPVHAPHIEDVRHRIGFSAKDLFVVLQSVFGGEEAAAYPPD